MVALDEPRILGVGARKDDLAPWRIRGPIDHPLDPERWAEERQYLRNDTRAAPAAFARRRADVLTLLRSLSPAEWQRGGVHLSNYCAWPTAGPILTSNYGVPDSPQIRLS